MTEQEQIQELLEVKRLLSEENRILKAKIFDFRIQLELILETPTEDLSHKKKMIKEIIGNSVDLTSMMKADIQEYIDAEYKGHPLLQMYDNFFGLYQEPI